MADAATSVLAIIALAGDWLYGWSWLDPAMGVVGAVVVAVTIEIRQRATMQPFLQR